MATRSRRTLIVAASVFGGLLLIAVVLVGIAAQAVEELFVRPVEEKIATDVADVLPLYEADLDALARHPFFHREVSAENAGVYLNKRLPWLPGATGGEGYPGDGTFALTDDQQALASAFPLGRPLTADEAATLAAMDFRWMTDLHRFGEWSLWTDSPLSKGALGSYLGDPVPRMVLLQSWVKLRLLEGRRTQSESAAAEDAAHLAWLALRTESFIVGMVGVAIIACLTRADIRDERVPPWARFTRDDVERLNRVVFGSPSFFYSPIDVDAQRMMLARGRRVDALWRAWGCRGLVEAWTFTTELKPLLAARAPQYYAHIDEGVAGEKSCRLTRLKLARQRLEEGRAGEVLGSFGVVANGDDDDGAVSWLPVVRFVPMVREAAGGILVAIATPNFLDRYVRDGGRAETTDESDAGGDER